MARSAVPPGPAARQRDGRRSTWDFHRVLLPGRVTLDDGRGWYEAAWGAVPSSRGRDSAGILEAAALGTIDTLVLVGADPLGDFPDRKLAEDGIEGAKFVVAVDAFLSPSSWRADVVLPATMAHERSGTTTNIEGRVSRMGQKLVAPGQSWPDWMIAAELAARLGGDLGVTSETELWDEIERLAPSHAGVTRSVLDSPSARDGIVVPIASSPVTLTRRLAPAPIDPTATPGIEAIERQGAPLRAGFAEPSGGEFPVRAQSNGAGQPARPKVMAWPQPLPTRHVPPHDSYSLRLTATRILYDDGVLLESCPELAKLVPTTTVARTPIPMTWTRWGCTVVTGPDCARRGAHWWSRSSSTPGMQRGDGRARVQRRRPRSLVRVRRFRCTRRGGLSLARQRGGVGQRADRGR